VEKATSRLAPVEDLAATGDGMPELVHTPGQRTIEEVSAFLGVERTHQMKTMAYMAEHSDADPKQIQTVGRTRAVVDLPTATDPATPMI
jgi:prolyl-tRNA synthetase